MAGVAWLAAAVAWRGGMERRGIALGLGAAWLVSTLSAGALMAAKPTSARAFWWAFGGGMALRLGTLVALMAATVIWRRLSAPGLLLSYAFGVLGCLLIEYRHIKLK